MKKQASWLLVAAFLSGMAGCGKKIPEDTIQVGKKADMVVLEQNILTCDPKTIAQTKVCCTIII